MPQPKTIAEAFVPVLVENQEVREKLASHNIDPQTYVLYMYAHERSRARNVGIALTVVFTIVFFALGFVAAGERDDVSPMWVGAILGSLGLLLGIGGMKYQQGWRLPYTNNPDNLSKGFTYLGLLNTFSIKYIKRLTDAKWKAIARARLDPADKRFALPQAEDRREAKLKAATHLTPRQARVVAVLERVQRASAWGALVVVLMFFTDGYFFAFLAWTSGSLWFFLDGLIGWIKRFMAAFTSETVEVYGWPARIVAVVVMLTAAMFLAGGVLGMISEL